MPDRISYRIIPTKDGRWSIMSDEADTVLAGTEYPASSKAIESLINLAMSKGMDTSIRVPEQGGALTVVMGKGLKNDRLRRVQASITTSDLNDIKEMSADLGVPRDDIFRRAIGLFKVAYDANGVGNRLAILTPEDDIVRDILAFQAKEPAVSSGAN